MKGGEERDSHHVAVFAVASPVFHDAKIYMGESFENRKHNYWFGLYQSYPVGLRSPRLLFPHIL